MARNSLSFTALLVMTVTLTSGTASDLQLLSSEVYDLCDPAGIRTVTLNATSHPFIIQSPYFGVSNYSNDANCKLIIKSEAEPLVLSFQYSEFIMEYHYRCYYDSLCVHGITYCHEWPRNRVFESILPPNSTSSIVFKTDSSVTNSGFEVTVTPRLAVSGETVMEVDGLGNGWHNIDYVTVKYTPGMAYKDACGIKF
ncbi:hypothetical protein BsWGS_21778 [Bradybaena similaris]